MKKSELIFTAVTPLLDFAMLFVAALAAYALRLSDFIAKILPVRFYLPLEKYFLLSIAAAITWLFIFALTGLYKPQKEMSSFREVLLVFIGASAGLAILAFYIFLTGKEFESRFIILSSWFFSLIFVSAGRITLRKIKKFLYQRFDWMKERVLVIGPGEISQRIINQISTNPSSGYRVVKFLPSPDTNLISKAVGNPVIDGILMTNSDYPAQILKEVAEFCEEHNLNFRFVPNIFQELSLHSFIDNVFGVPLIELRRSSLDGWGRITKRAIDVTGSILGFAIFFPFFTVIAFLIKWESDGPILVRLKRVSKGKEFYLYKFRSMIKNAHALKSLLAEFNEREGPLFKMKNDPRVTSLGRILRKYRLDELPQLINVLKGEMSLVGPRPHEPEEIAKYERHHKRVLGIKAGVTGLAQISGSSDLSLEDEVRFDTFYIENWSLLFDVKILIKTIFFLFKDKSAC